MQQRRYIDFYEKNQIIPVNQDLSNLEKHLRRRDGLYRHLGIIPSWLRDKDVLEFGPGTGDNAIHTASKNPRRYVLVDANKYSINSVQDKISSGRLRGESLELHHCDMLDFRADKTFDVVLCEGMLDGQKDSTKYLQHAASFVKPGGVIVTTTSDHISMLGDVCRRVVKPIFQEKYGSSDILMKKLLEFFTPDFDAMPSMSKLRKDWILDTVLHPWEEDMFFSFPEAVQAIGDQFDVHGASPHFLTDWRWYKTITGDDPLFNQIALDNYNAKRHYFLDFRLQPQTIGECDTERLHALAYQAYLEHLEIWNENNLKSIPDYLATISDIAHLVSHSMRPTSAALSSYVNGVNSLLFGTEQSSMTEFWGMFGRAQQYFSFIRRET